jgi:hypothetical protein
MEELCSRSTGDDAELRIKLELFLKDRSADAVTGIRRMGRSNLVQLASSMCGEMGISSSLYPDTTGRDIIIFDHWNGMDEVIDDIMCQKPKVDILFGQDLCHQVPAIVRRKER